jgi:putative ABC transport system permease protein
MANKTLIISSFRKITKSSKRFISLLCMALLGVGFFVGIESTSPDMLTTLDAYLDKTKAYDLQIQSTLGLTADDLAKLEKLPNIDKVQGTYSKDAFIKFDNGKQGTLSKEETAIAKVIGMTDTLNQIDLVKGKLPQKNDEILVEPAFLTQNKLKIGDQLYLSDPDLANTTYKIVGTVKSPLYFSKNHRGTTSIGDGQINYFMYVRPEVFKQDVYSAIDLTVKRAASKMTGQTAYLDLISAAKKEITGIKKTQEKQRFETVYADYLNLAAQSPNQVDLGNLPAAKWYIFDRQDDTGYKDFVDATKSIAKIGNVFPIVFYIIAILISLVSMTRMVEEDRSEIGTLKALGFSNRNIALKYLIFSLLATLVGGVIGMVTGLNLIPSLIWSIYTTLFMVPHFTAGFQAVYCLVGLAFAVICICGGALFSVYRELVYTPSVLMRPKAPKAGKRILLEYLPFIWKRLKFSNKIVTRNLFRYKTRATVTILGITGCTALILAGFGLKDSITDIVTYQYANVFRYDKMVTLKPRADNSTLLQTLAQDSQVDQLAEMAMATKKVSANGKSYEINLVVPDTNPTFNKVISLNDINQDKKQVSLQANEAIVSQKLARLLGVKEKDKISFKDDQDKVHEIKVGKIAENYIGNYVYLSKASYEQNFGPYETNVLVLSFKHKLSNKASQAFDQSLISNPAVAGVFNSKAMVNMINDVMSSLNLVVLILIVSSAILAFVVMYNLANINISERKREIATLKVLGFYDKEIDAYITKENIVFTAVGIILGLFGGVYLGHFIISTCETTNLMFIRHVNPLSFVFATALTVSFTMIVNLITHFSLKGIDMIDALKSIE